MRPARTWLMAVRRRAIGLFLCFLMVAASLITLSACGAQTRSVAAYCSYFYGQGGTLRERWLHNSNRAGQDPIAALAGVFTALPEAASFLHQLSLRAPEDIAPDVQTLSDALRRAADVSGSGDPLSSLVGGLVNGFAATGAEQRVNLYTVQHCGGPP
jgi:hypothetical protein